MSAGEEVEDLEYCWGNLESGDSEKLVEERTEIVEYQLPCGTVRIRTTPHKGVAFYVWACALVLSRWMHENGELVRGKRVLELGAGTGLAGIAAVLCGASEAVITDLEPVVPLIEENIALNGIPANRARALALPWGGPVEHVGGPVDLVIAADVVYLESTFELLLDTLGRLLATPATHLTLVYQKRRKADRRFFQRCAKRFEVTAERETSVPGATITVYRMRCRAPAPGPGAPPPP
eukprot:tig00000448_g871.t1